jgi:hypothetical protein
MELEVSVGRYQKTAQLSSYDHGQRRKQMEIKKVFLGE